MDEELFAFGPFRLIPAQRTLFEDGKALRLGSRAFDILVALIERAGETVSKEELIARAWPGTVVGEAALTVHVAALRKALGDGRAGKRYIATLSGRGYAFTAPVTREKAAATPALNGMAKVGSLPIRLTRVIGRDGVVSRLAQQLVRCRFLTIVGPGGIGKTTVAVAVAGNVRASYKDGAWFVGLASLSDPDLVPSAVCAALGLRPSGGEHTRALAAWLRDRMALLVLDNCEHVIAAATALAEAILKAARHASILATSREPLRAEGEWLHHLEPLELPPEAKASPTADEALGYSAVELFNERATATMNSFALDDADVPAVLEICRRLDGVPLALELAAARIATSGIGELAARLDDRFSVLTSGRRTALPRHQTLRATLDWSYDLLTEEERTLLCRLAVFPAGFTLGGAVAVSGEGERGGAAVIIGIASLIQKSLVAAEPSEAGSRWRLLETIRSYSLDKLAERGEADEAARRHAAYFRDFFTSAMPDFRYRLPAEVVIRYGREIDNVRAALDWSFSSSGHVAIGIDLTAAYAPVLINLSLVPECRERCERALHCLDAGPNVNSRLQMLLQLNLGISLLHTAGPSPQAQDILIQALETAEILGDLDAQARALFLLASVHRYRAEYGKASTTIERLRQICQQIGDPFIAATVDRYTGNNLIDIGMLAEGQRCFERVIQSSVHIEGQRLPIWWEGAAERALARAMLARAFWLQGFAERAKNEARESLVEVRGADHVLIVQVLYFSICHIAPMTGDFAAAESAITWLIEATTNLNSRFWMTVAQSLKGKLMVERGEFAEGLDVLRTAFATFSETGWRPSYPEFRGSLALALGGLGRVDEANDVVSEAIASVGGRDNGRHWYAPELLRIKADILLRQSPDRSGMAEDCLGQAATMARDQGALFWELRIALSLARLRVAQGRQEEARQILAPVYDRFTEGFDTADLIWARALLDTLR